MTGTLRPGLGEPEAWSADDIRKVRQTVERVLDVLHIAVWAVRPNLHIDFANAAAMDVAHAGTLAQVASGKIMRIGTLDAQRLRHALTPPLHAGRQQVMAGFNHTSGYNRCSTLHLLPLQGHQALANIWPHANAIVLLELWPFQDSSKWLAHIAEHWGLSEAQSATLGDLARGHTVDAIAVRRGVKEGTIRTHLHELFKRTGLRRQVDLVRLALGEWSDDLGGPANR